MKVSGTKSGGVSKAGGKPSSPQSSKTEKRTVDTVARSGETDALEVSDHMATIEIIKGLVSSNPDIRMEEVDRIAKKLKDGTYKIDYEKVADAFIREAIVNEISKKPRKK